MEPGAGRGVVVPPWQTDHAASRLPGAAEALQAKVLTADEARRIAINIARLPERRGKGERG